MMMQMFANVKKNSISRLFGALNQDFEKFSIFRIKASFGAQNNDFFIFPHESSFHFDKTLIFNHSFLSPETN